MVAKPGLPSIDVGCLRELTAQYPVLVIPNGTAFGLAQPENYSAAGFAFRLASFSSIAERMNLK